MQEQLISALQAIRPAVQDTERLTNVIGAVHKSSIAYNDYKKVVLFIDLLLEQMPELHYAAPHDQALKALCIHCLDHLKLPDETSKKPHRAKPRRTR